MTNSSPANLEFASFSLSGPSRHVRDGNLPVRGDLAHIRLAGEVFVPHYAVPMPHRVIADAVLVAASRDDAAAIADVPAGTSFDVLDMAGAWAWGVVGENGPVGYLPIAGLESGGLESGKLEQA
ncbi:SH3 domain-containing protein [Croceicoccus ponticola]|uniref:SH3 domain-containing protein n=1 Tax=Croceicoccus ponticola TaxID=2217664 RepID=A0A437GWF4_9SPHN|nr:SH3 domain-containing protein [Croceicoccus ponticola]RVQ66437.1 SH3 domain-containing protein [Croceicoccus ponticola]